MLVTIEGNYFVTTDNDESHEIQVKQYEDFYLAYCKGQCIATARLTTNEDEDNQEVFLRLMNKVRFYLEETI